jgi:hypothetical protein
MNATFPVAAASFALVLGLVAIAPAPAFARDPHDELRWTEGVQALSPPAKSPAQTRTQQPPAKARPPAKTVQVAEADRPARRPRTMRPLAF